MILGSIFFRGVLVRRIINGRAHVLFNGDAILASLKQNSERCECVVSLLLFFFFVKCRKRERFLYFPMDLPPARVTPRRRQRTMRGPSSRGLDGGYSRWFHAGISWGLETDVMDKAEICFFFASVWKLILSSIFPYFKKCLLFS